jgi:hypothetical protein
VVGQGAAGVTLAAQAALTIASFPAADANTKPSDQSLASVHSNNGPPGVSTDLISNLAQASIT